MIGFVAKTDNTLLKVIRATQYRDYQTNYLYQHQLILKHW